jgi:hypothetical protein
MKIFISCSGNRSNAVAKALNDWLPKVIQAIEPFYYPEIEKGANWSNEVNANLEGTSFGIICLTRENLENRWIHYEAGALAKTAVGRVWTLLLGINHVDVAQPLAQFKHTLGEKEDIRKLMNSINRNLPQPLPLNILNDTFEKWWSEFEEELKKAEKLDTQKPKSAGEKSGNIRSDRELLNEVLELLRVQYKPLTTYERLGFRIEEKSRIARIDFRISKEKLKLDKEEIINQIKKVFSLEEVSVYPSRSSYSFIIVLNEYIDENEAMSSMEDVSKLLNLAGIDYRLTNSYGEICRYY